MLTIDAPLRQKIERRARRAFAALDAGDTTAKFHRITEVGPDSLKYRLSHRLRQPRYSGPRLTITRDAAGTIHVPDGPPVEPLLDLVKDDDLAALKTHNGPVRAYKLTTAEGKGIYYPTITYEVGKQIEALDAETNPKRDCAPGVNLGTQAWVRRHFKPGYRVFAIEFDAAEVAAIPVPTDGKFRVFRCVVTEERDPKDPSLPLGDTPEEKKGIIDRLLGR